MRQPGTLDGQPVRTSTEGVSWAIGCWCGAGRRVAGTKSSCSQEVIEVAKLGLCAGVGGSPISMPASLMAAPGAGPTPVRGVLIVDPDRVIDTFDQ